MEENNEIRLSAQELKAYFLKNAYPIVDQYIKAALGKEDLKSLSSDCRKEVWDLIKSLMLQSSDKLELNIESVEDILKAVENGKCTFEEGDKLMGLYKKAKEIEMSGKLGTISDGGGGIVVNILAAPVQSVPLVPVIESK